MTPIIQISFFSARSPSGHLALWHSSPSSDFWAVQAGRTRSKESGHYTAKPSWRELSLSWKHKYNFLKQIKYRALLIQPNFKTQGLPTKLLRNTLMLDFHSTLVKLTGRVTKAKSGEKTHILLKAKSIGVLKRVSPKLNKAAPQGAL